MAYLFDPEVLARIVRMHVGLPCERQLESVAKTLRDVFGDHVSPGQRWMWSNTGGLMRSACLLHVSHNEALALSGSAIGSEGHSGRHRADLYYVVLSGELWSYEPGSFERRAYRAGELARVAKGAAHGVKLQPGTWLLEYARGPVAGLVPFSSADTLFSTLDTHDFLSLVTTSTRLMLKEALVCLDERKRGQPFRPNLDAVSKESTAVKKPKRNGRANVN